MESVNSSPSASSNSVEAEEAIAEKSPEQWFNDQFDNLLPKIQERWPDLAKQTESTYGPSSKGISLKRQVLQNSLSSKSKSK